VLDEHGLTEVAVAHNIATRPAIDRTTFAVRNHGWERESPLSFIHPAGIWSWLVVTGGLCLEIVSCEEPGVEFLRFVEPVGIERTSQPSG
jgi:hypothetical protein